MSRTLANALSVRAHGLDHVRLIAALAVVVSHAYPLALGRGTPEPLQASLGVSLGHCAVLVFFVLSGVLIARAAERTRPVAFWLARILRIFPGLCVALVVTVICAVASGAEPTLRDTAQYVLRGVSLVSLEHSLPGAYAQNPYSGAVNGPLWTLFYEVACYALVAAVIWFTPVGRWGWLVILGMMAGAVLAAEAGHLPHHRLTVGAPLAFAFALGATAWAWRDRIVLRADVGPLILLLGTGLAAMTTDKSVANIALAVSLGYAALVYGLRPTAKSLGGDISYGVYVLGWPTSQTLVATFGDMSPEMLGLVSVALVIPLAWLSWTIVERPALSLRHWAPLAKATA